MAIQAIVSPMASTRRFVPVTGWEDERQVLGLDGERVALGYLTACGWAIEAHRFRLGRHDVDLVARRGSLVAFVEVKTRRSAAFGSPLEAVTRRKQRDLAKTAALWIMRHGRSDDEYRFDLIGVQERRGEEPLIEHVEDAWRPESWIGR
jgi:putative endonuclease